MFCMGETLVEPNQQALNAKKIENYIFRYEDLLGRGNFGQAFRGYDVNTGQPVAIKVIKMNSIKSKVSERLLSNEIQILRNLKSHSNILRCTDVFTSVNNCYIITELCQQDLSKELRKKGKFNQYEVKQLVYGIYKGLEQLGKNSIVHRDIKVSNIFLSKNGTPKIADFGFATKASSTFKDLKIGSPLYMSPQGLIYNQYGPKTDVWSFGVLIYELINGETPLQRCRTDEQLKTQILLHPVFPNPISAQLRQLIQACLTVDPSRRPSIFQLGEFGYIQNIRTQQKSEFKKSASNISTQCSIKIPIFTKNPYFYTSSLTYENGISLLHYCRLLHKINQKYLKSKLLGQMILNILSSLSQTTFKSTDVFNQQLNKLKQVSNQYYNKYKSQYTDKSIFVNPRQILTQISKLIKYHNTNKFYIDALHIIDTQIKVLVYSLEHQNPDIFTKNSQAKNIIDKASIPF